MRGRGEGRGVAHHVGTAAEEGVREGVDGGEGEERAAESVEEDHVLRLLIGAQEREDWGRQGEGARVTCR